MKSRTYTSPLRARSAERTRHRILDAAFARITQDYYDDVTLDLVAADAGVAVQTVLRHFDSKEGLIRAIVESRTEGVLSQRDAAPVGDIAGAIANLFDHYEDIGDVVMMLLRQEERVPPFAEVTDTGRAYHVVWIDRVFAPWLSPLPASDRRVRHAQLVALCDTYMWFLLRGQQGLSRDEAQRAVVEMVTRLLD